MNNKIIILLLLLYSSLMGANLSVELDLLEAVSKSDVVSVQAFIKEYAQQNSERKTLFLQTLFTEAQNRINSLTSSKNFQTYGYDGWLEFVGFHFFLGGLFATLRSLADMPNPFSVSSYKTPTLIASLAFAGHVSGNLNPAKTKKMEQAYEIERIVDNAIKQGNAAT